MSAMAHTCWLRSRRAIVGAVELRQLAAFVAVADELHFGRAAERLGVVQPAVSQLVRRLEQELGIILFERSSHHVTLTGEGAELLSDARSVLAASDALATRAAALIRGEQGELRIGTTEGISQNLNLLLARFAETHPKAAIRLEALHTPAKLKALRAGELDIAFLRAPVELTGLRSMQLWSEPLVVVLPDRDPLSSQDEIRLSALSSLPLILSPRHANPGIHDELLKLCHDAGLQPQFGPELHNVQEALATIASGTAWTLLTTTNAPQGVPGVAVRPLAGHRAHTNVTLAWRATGASQLTNTFTGLAREARDQGDLAPTALQTTSELRNTRPQTG
jgi:DNA-binding transcriptional LysR family regulator